MLISNGLSQLFLIKNSSSLFRRSAAMEVRKKSREQWKGVLGFVFAHLFVVFFLPFGTSERGVSRSVLQLCFTTWRDQCIHTHIGQRFFFFFLTFRKCRALWVFINFPLNSTGSYLFLCCYILGTLSIYGFLTSCICWGVFISLSSSLRSSGEGSVT